MSKQLCSNRPCSNLVERGRCEPCKANKVNSEYRPNSTQRGYGARWQKTSRARLLAHPWCVDPKRRHPGRLVPATLTDHIDPHRGDMAKFWDPNNWQSLCDSCHSFKTSTEEGGFGHHVSVAGVGQISKPNAP